MFHNVKKYGKNKSCQIADFIHILALPLSYLHNLLTKVIDMIDIKNTKRFRSGAKKITRDIVETIPG